MAEELQTTMSAEEEELFKNRKLKFKYKQQAKRKPVPFALTMTSMMDMFTIILTFLLKQYSTDTTNINQSDVLRLPVSTSDLNLEPAVQIQITKAGIMVNDEFVVELVDKKVEARFKKDGEAGFFINPLYDKLMEEAQKEKHLASMRADKPFAGLVMIVADAETPFRLLTEVMYTSGQAEYGNFKFTVVSSTKG